MNPKMLELESKAEEKIIQYTIDIRELQREVKRWEQVIRIDEINKISKDCFDSFNNFQMFIAKELKNNAELTKECKLKSHKDTYDFLTFVETKIDSETFNFIAKKAPNFIGLITQYSNYCNKIEKEYNIELPSETILKS